MDSSPDAPPDNLTPLNGGPTKRLFVSMLTRDIELSDAILDLLDNCVDGAIRQTKDAQDSETPYSGYSANLEISGDVFRLEDNCGGIPDESLKDAFALGRPNIDKDGDIPTIGMYGIGMKRAIFKIAQEATVSTTSSQSAYKVDYSREWLDPDNDKWELPLRQAQPASEPGVIIDIPYIKPEISATFGKTAFITTLKEQIETHFGYIMQRGFNILLNGRPVKPRTLSVYNLPTHGQPSISPYVYRQEREGVEVLVVVGFFRKLVRDQEIDQSASDPAAGDRAGISVICNDRVILHSDTTAKTGWGEGTVPRFHPQFRAIAGLISFRSQSAANLPISTTKRGIEIESDIYFLARSAAQEGIKMFTTFTNKWKGRETETERYFRGVEAQDAIKTEDIARQAGRPKRNDKGSLTFRPELPTPQEDDPHVRISFHKPEKEIAEVSRHLFGEEGPPAAKVGEGCFEKILQEVRDNGRK